MANIKPYDDKKTGGKGTVPHAGFSKSTEKEFPDFDLDSMFTELSELIVADAGQADDGWDSMKVQMTAD